MLPPCITKPAPAPNVRLCAAVRLTAPLESVSVPDILTLLCRLIPAALLIVTVPKASPPVVLMVAAVLPAKVIFRPFWVKAALPAVLFQELTIRLAPDVLLRVKAPAMVSVPAKARVLAGRVNVEPAFTCTLLGAPVPAAV